jgi:acylphosphatase
MPARCREYEGEAAVGPSGGHERGPAAVSDLVRRRVVVHGHVQGVFFRDTTRREATRRGVTGWVRNRPDGAVEAVFEGSPDAVAAMADFCESGPRGADVHRVETSDEEPEGLSGFDVR